MTSSAEVPPGNAAKKIRIRETDPIQESSAPNGEIRAYEIDLYDGQRWKTVNIAVQDDIEINASNLVGAFRFNRGAGRVAAPIQSPYTHLAATFDSGNMEFFVNGSSVGTATSAIPSSGNVFDIGRRPAGDNHYDGRIDAVRIYNSVLSPSQINQVFQNTKP